MERGLHQESWQETRRHVACKASGRKPCPAGRPGPQPSQPPVQAFSGPSFHVALTLGVAWARRYFFPFLLLGTLRKGSGIQIPNWNPRLSP